MGTMNYFDGAPNGDDPAATAKELHENMDVVLQSHIERIASTWGTKVGGVMENAVPSSPEEFARASLDVSLVVEDFPGETFRLSVPPPDGGWVRLDGHDHWHYEGPEGHLDMHLEMYLENETKNRRRERRQKEGGDWFSPKAFYKEATGRH